EPCYGVLLKLLENIAHSQEEPKFRSLRKSNAAIKAKVLDVPGGSAFLLAAGFEEDEEAFKLPLDASVENCKASLESLRAHARARHDDNYRAVRDEKIAREKAEEAVLADMGGFARGRHKLSGGSTDAGAGSNKD
ncbi:unnamed protein product, partial [Polarella glacialis]